MKDKKVTDKAYAVGVFYGPMQEFLVYEDDRMFKRKAIFPSRELANAFLKSQKENIAMAKDAIVVEVTVRKPKWKREMTKEEIEKALGFEVVILGK